MFDEEESKRLRIFQRGQRQELQLIIERCNEVGWRFNVCMIYTNIIFIFN